MNITKLFAKLFLRSRPLVCVAVLVFTALAVVGYVTKDDTRHQWARRSSEREARSDIKQLRNVNAAFDLRHIQYFLVIDTDDVFTPENAAALRSIADKLAQLDIVADVTWLGGVPNLNLFSFGNPLLPDNNATRETFAEAKKRALEHPLIGGQLLSKDGRTLLMLVSFDWVYYTGDEDVSNRLIETAQNALDQHKDVDIHIGLTGEIPLYLAQRAAHERNHRKYQIIGYAMVAIVATLLFRSLAPILIVSTAAGLGIFWAIGFLHLFGQEINPLTGAILPLMLAMVGVSDGVHLMVHIRRARRDGLTRVESAGSAIEHVGLPCLLTSLTTAVGFGSLMLADSAFVRSFGQACALGVCISFFAVVMTIPLLSSTWMGRNLDRGQRRDVIGRSLQRYSGLVEWTIRRRRAITLVAVALTVLFAALATLLRPDSRYASALPTHAPAYQALAHCDETFGGIEFARIVVQWPETVKSDSPAILKAVADVETVLDDEPLLSNPVSLRGILRTFPGDQQYLDERMSMIALMPPQVRQLFFDRATRQTQIQMRVQDVGIAQYEPVFRRIESKLDALSKKHAGFRFHLTGEPVVRGRNLYQIVVDLAASLSAAAVIILVIMALVYRSIRLGLIAVVPNMFPLAATATLLVLMGGSLEISGVCAFTVCLGIAVDDTIHFLSRYQYERKEHPAHEAIRRTWVRVGTALLMTTIVMVSGFSTVLTSELPQQRVFAAMACVTIAAALVGDMIFLPAMLAWLTTKETQRTAELKDAEPSAIIDQS